MKFIPAKILTAAEFRGDMCVQILLSETQIREGVQRLAAQVEADYRGRPLTILGVLTGSLVLLADLMRNINLPLRVGLIQASSYRGRATTAGALTIQETLVPDIQGRDVLLLDDILDTGHTLEGLLTAVRRNRPATLRSAVLLWKEGRQVVNVTPDHFVFRIPDKFVVGYGLDYNGYYRNLPGIGVLKGPP